MLVISACASAHVDGSMVPDFALNEWSGLTRRERAELCQLNAQHHMNAAQHSNETLATAHLQLVTAWLEFAAELDRPA